MGLTHKGKSHARVPWFSWAWLAEAAQQEALHDFSLAAPQRRGVPFNPATPSLGSRASTCWVLQDASGSEGGAVEPSISTPTEEAHTSPSTPSAPRRSPHTAPSRRA